MFPPTTIGTPAPGSMIGAWARDPKGSLQLSGAEPALSAEEQDVQRRVHEFAAEVMRPVGRRLDRMSPEEVIAAGSPLWDVYRGFAGLGLGVDRFLELEPQPMARMMCLVFEELGWGDAGLAISLGASMLPRLTAAKFGNRFLLERTAPSLIGCWGAAEPRHGSDVVDANGHLFDPRGDYGRPDCVATIGADGVVINGRKAEWVSNGSIAQVCILQCVADTGNGPDVRQGCFVVVPLDAAGVSRGDPLDKIGQRSLNQGGLIFDNVELPLDYVLAGPEDYLRACYSTLSDGNAIMAVTFTGAARAAFELALGFAHERRQGGVPIIRHQNVAYRLFHMYRKVEAARALSRRALVYNYTQPEPAMHVAMAAKITSTQNSFEVASDAVQIFGARGLTAQYPIEKIFRDTRASLIEDGCNEVLAIKGGSYLIDDRAG
ncbi:acyl-CoA dehydrogenase family protein [Actinoplanes sp. NPDC049118]|uniref:acyl-CoA dehydrogenase family protein n=1 Tax=Actinoplanes sp. NPDC049118 TaxID=3155769 RepID=UPI00340F194C